MPTSTSFPTAAALRQPERDQRLRIAVGIATSGRAAILAETLADLARQTLQPHQVFVLYSRDEDIADLEQQFPSCRFAKGVGGLCEKRNRILDDACEADLLFFMDDDFFLDPRYLAVTEEAFRRDRNLVASTGIVLADGAKGPGLSTEEATQVLNKAAASDFVKHSPVAAFNTYGCNMAFRLATVREHSLRFDEQLPAYAWYEDIDFSRRLAQWGSLMCLPDALGVHLGAKVGRVSGRRLGYSQVANPIYLSRKGSFPWGNTVRSIGRNVCSNLLWSVLRDPYVDRRGRLRGNLLAFRELLAGRMHPNRILRMA